MCVKILSAYSSVYDIVNMSPVKVEEEASFFLEYLNEQLPRMQGKEQRFSSMIVGFCHSQEYSKILTFFVFTS